MALRLPGFYARQASEAGLWGVIGFVLFFCVSHEYVLGWNPFTQSLKGKARSIF
jgi:hypothetical protein